MKIDVLSSTDTKTTLQLDGVSVAYVNTLRRLIKKHVPTMAVDTVEFKENNSALYDEILAHRIGLLVLSTDLDSFNTAEQDAEPTAATHTQLSLKAEGPGTVYAKDLEPQTKQVKPVHGDTPIVKLKEGQKVELIATARLGTGSEHSKFDPGLVTYYYKPKITVKKDISEATLSKYPPQIVEDGEVSKERILHNPNLLDACEGVSDAIQVNYEEPANSFIFTVEPWGQLPVSTLLTKAISLHNEQLEVFKEKLEDI